MYGAFSRRLGAFCLGLWLLSLFEGIFPALGLWLLLSPLLLLWVLLPDLLSFSAPGRALMRADPRALTILLLSLLGLWLLRFSLQELLLLIMDRVQDPSLLPVIAALLALLLTSALLPPLILLSAPLEQGLGVLPRPLFFALAALLLWLALWGPWQILAKNLRPQPFLFTLLSLSLVLFARRIPWRLWSAVSLASVSLCVGLYALWAYSKQPELRRFLEERQGLTPYIVAGFHRLTDGDGDGFSPYLGGGDCDDQKPEKNPLAYDFPENGLDEDCQGGDAVAFPHEDLQTAKHTPLPPQLQKPWNLLFITIEALRPQQLSLYGNERSTSPQMEALAQEGLLFERAYTPANATRHALPTLMARRDFGDLDLLRSGNFIQVQESNRLLFQRLQEQGWYNEALISTELARGMFYGLEQGFERFEGVEQAGLRQRSAPRFERAFKTNLERALKSKKPWATWIHLMDPHEPYLSHKGFPFGRKTLERYEAEIAYTDQAIGRLWELLKVKGEAARTIILITSDHGEEFGEHGGRFHGKTLYEESIRVPWLIHIPGAPARRYQAPVSTLDIPETLANLMGLPPGLDYGGQSQVSRLFDSAEPNWNRLIYVDCIRKPEQPRDRLVSLLEWPYKVILDFKKGHEHLFNLEEDPKEEQNLREEQPERFERLAGLIRREDRRNQARLTERLKQRFISRNPPPKHQAVQVAPGLEWLGSEIETQRPHMRELHFIRSWFRAAGSRRDDLHIQFSFEGGGMKSRRQRYRPLAGLYPTQRWAEGEVLEDLRLVRFVKRKGEIKVSLEIYKGRERLFGPVGVGTIHSWIKR